MAHNDAQRGRRRPPTWFLVTLGAAVVGVVGWFAARTRRDRLVARAGEVLHTEAQTAVPDDASVADGADGAEGAAPVGDKGDPAPRA